jgi:hypothetical protein
MRCVVSFRTQRSTLYSPTELRLTRNCIVPTFVERMRFNCGYSYLLICRYLYFAYIQIFVCAYIAIFGCAYMRIYGNSRMSIYRYRPTCVNKVFTTHIMQTQQFIIWHSNIRMRIYRNFRMCI